MRKRSSLATGTIVRTIFDQFGDRLIQELKKHSVTKQAISELRSLMNQSKTGGKFARNTLREWADNYSRKHPVAGSAIQPLVEDLLREIGKDDKGDTVANNKKNRSDKKAPPKVVVTPSELIDKGRALVAKLGNPITSGILSWFDSLTINEQNRIYQKIGKNHDPNSLMALYEHHGDGVDARVVFGIHHSTAAPAAQADGGTEDSVGSPQLHEPETESEKARIVMSWIAERNEAVFKLLQDVMAVSESSDSHNDRPFFDAYLASFYVVGPAATVKMFDLSGTRSVEEMANITNVRPNVFTKFKEALKSGFEKLRENESPVTLEMVTAATTRADNAEQKLSKYRKAKKCERAAKTKKTKKR